MRQLRIVHCFRSPVGGIFRHVRDLAEAQVAAGHQVGIICDSTTGGELEARLIEEIRPMLPLGATRTPMQRHVGPGDIAAAWKMFNIIKEMRPDILHGHGAKGGAYARLFGSFLRMTGYPVARLYSPHGGALHYDETKLTGKLVFAVERMMMRFTDHLLFVSGYELETFRRKVGEPRPLHRLVYNGLQSREFEPVALADGAADFLYIGMMRDLKGPDIFIDALALVEARLQRQICAVMVGDGDDRPRYEAQANRLGLSERIRFFKPMPARRALGLARTVVVPSRAEAMPYIVLEALAAGKSVIASAVGGIPEVFGTDSRALLNPGPAELAEKMAEALRSPDAFAAAMPTLADLKARFGADTMARHIGEAYLASIKS
jgi:glycosyltransferase involved in cell wall biosynthesis